MKLEDVELNMRVIITDPSGLSFEGHHFGGFATVSYIDESDPTYNVEVCLDNGRYDWGHCEHIEKLQTQEED